MRLSKYPRIRFGRENYKITPKDLRKDVIYKVYLGDRQVWSKDKDDTEQDLSIVVDNRLRMTWHIFNYLNLGNVTSATSIAGTISWGDGAEEDWESGQTYSHKYSEEGDYEVILTCAYHLPLASIGQLVNYAPAAINQTNIPYLIGVNFCTVPYLSTGRLYEPFYGGINTEKKMFEDEIKLDNIMVPLGITAITEKMFYNTGLKNITLSCTLETLGSNCFVRSNTVDSDERLTIIIQEDVIEENNKLTPEILSYSGLGYRINDSGSSLQKINDIIVYCPENQTALANYFSNFGAEVIIITE